MHKLKLPMLFLIFFFLLLLLPRFDGKDFYSFLLSDGEVPFNDGKSSIVAWTFLKLKEGDLCFLEGEQFGSIKIGENVDFYKIEDSDCFIPTHSVMIIVFFLLPFGLLPSTINELTKFLVLGNMLYASLGLCFFYLLLSLFHKKNAFIFTLIVGACTGWIIYSFSLLLEIVYTSLFLGCVYFAISFYKRGEDKFFLLFSLFFFLLIIALPYDYSFSQGFLKYITYFLTYGLVLVLPLLILLFATRRITRNKLFFLVIAYIIVSYFPVLVLFPYDIERSGVWASASQYYFLADENPGAVSTELFGYTTANRVHAFLYSFKDRANGLFLNSYGLFGSLFSEKGIVYNSPFLIFGLIGLLFFKPKNLRNALLMIMVLNMSVSVLSSTWHGGYTPRYVRHYFPTVFVLSIFAFDYIQKNKNLLVRLLFAGLVLLSFLNVMSLAVRLDWSYENPERLVSYDYVLWPFLLHGEDYASFVERNACPPVLESGGWILDPCDCQASSKLVREGGDFFIFSCTRRAGGDGVFLNYSYDDVSDSRYLESNNCTFFRINSTSDVSFWVERFGVCDAEMVELKFLDVK